MRYFSFFKIFLGLLLLGLCLGGCSSMSPRQFSDSKPVFDPQAFFNGHTQSWGVLENRAGKPIKRITTQTHGKMIGDTLVMEQDLHFDGQKKQHRSWRMKKIDAHHYEASANDMIGTAKGVAYGNTFQWSFTLELAPKNIFSRVRMTQTMYLQPDGKTMINRDSIRKSGILVAQVTEQFRKIK